MYAAAIAGGCADAEEHWAKFGRTLKVIEVECDRFRMALAVAQSQQAKLANALAELQDNRLGESMAALFGLATPVKKRLQAHVAGGRSEGSAASSGRRVQVADDRRTPSAEARSDRSEPRGRP